MTEAEWLACDDPMAMLAHPGIEKSGRKLRLLCCACWRCREEPNRISEYREAVEAAERFADGMIGKGELRAARDTAQMAGGKNTAYWCAALANRRLSAYRSARNVLVRLLDLLFSPEDRSQRLARYCHLFRDIFGNPFRPVALEPLRDAALLAHAAYDARALPSGHLDNARLAVLSDALEEAGCTNANILAHLRSPGPHVRGCWALDLVLGKT
jgi:hypothetical protein